MEIDVLFAAVPVSDMTAARSWYEQLFGRAADIVPHQREAMWQVTDRGWFYVMEDAARAGASVVTMAVADLDSVVTELGGRGIAAGPTVAVGDAGQKANVTDPDGNVISLIQVAAG